MPLVFPESPSDQEPKISYPLQARLLSDKAKGLVSEHAYVEALDCMKEALALHPLDKYRNREDENKCRPGELISAARNYYNMNNLKKSLELLEKAYIIKSSESIQRKIDRISTLATRPPQGVGMCEAIEHACGFSITKDFFDGLYLH
ncbi:unnamed protein product [Protopolystoma xenopodis]|uniref:Uncharacterized protein n=1 Tax=Protopolystoma xenopodis TaxID=117903 RepID=A0A448XRQ2_9PLAT|nr:unnamed protein product [Protopolystoma xenopodis]